MKLPVAIQLYSLRDIITDDTEEKLAALSKMGYEGIEFGGLYEHTADRWREMLKKCNLIPVSAHISLKSMLSDPDDAIEPYRRIGCKWVVIPYLDGDHRPDVIPPEQILGEIRKVAEAAKRLGVKALYHNHNFEFYKTGDEYFLDRIYRTIPAEILDSEIDTCWVNFAGEDPCAYLEKYAGRIPLVHYKDFVRGDGDDPIFRHLGGGVQDFAAITETAKAGGAEWIIYEQDAPSEGASCMECAERSIKFLKQSGIC